MSSNSVSQPRVTLSIRKNKKQTSSRIRWKDELEEKFLSVVDELGPEATPAKILQEMRVEGLTRGQVSSHLQQHRRLIGFFPLKHPADEPRNSCPVSTEGGKQITGSNQMMLGASSWSDGLPVQSFTEELTPWERKVYSEQMCAPGKATSSFQEVGSDASALQWVDLSTVYTSSHLLEQKSSDTKHNPVIKQPNLVYTSNDFVCGSLPANLCR